MADKIITTITTGTNLTVKAFAEEPPITVKTLSAGPGVSTSLEMKNLLDVDDTAEADGRILIYNSASDKHIYIDRFDSASATGLVDSSYVQLRQIKYTTADFTDSSYVASVLPVFGTDFVDSAYVISVLPTLGNDFVDSAYVTNLPISTFTNDADYLDSTTVTGVINSGYIQTNQIKYSTNDFTDSAFVSSSISTAVNNLIDGAPGTLDTLNEIAAALNDDDSAVNSLTALINGKDSDFVKSAANQAWIQSQQITYNTSNFTDSAYVQSVLPTLGGDFVDSAYVTSLPISTFTNDADYLDSTTVVGVINATYVQNNQIKYTTADFTDSAYVTSVLPTLGGDFVDSAYVTNLPISTFSNDANYLDSTTVLGVVNQSYVQSNQITYSTNDFTDSAYVQSVLPTLGGDFVDSAYVTSLPVSTFTNDADYLDSTTVQSVIDQTYVQTNQITYNTSNFADSAFVSAQINALIDGAPGTLDTLNEIAAALNDDDSAVNSLTTLINAKDSDFVKSAADQTWIQSQQIKYSTADFTDSAYVTSVLPTLGGDFVDSAFVTSLPISTFTNDADYLDSTTVLGVIDQTYVQNNQIKYTTADFTDSAYVTSVLPTLGGDFVDSSYVTGLPVSTFSNDTNYLDSTTVTGVIDTTYVQNNQIKYTTADFTDSAYVLSVLPTLGGDFVDSAYVTGLPVSTFSNDANYLDSTTVTDVIDATYVQNNQIKYTTADFTDSAYVTSVLPTLGNDFVDSAYVTSLPVSTFSNDANYLDSTTATGLIDSAYVQLRQTPGTDSAAVLALVTSDGFTKYDSTNTIGLVDSAYVQLRQIKYTNADFTDSAYVNSVLPTLGGDFVDSSYVTSLPVSTFTNDADYLDSTTVTGVINSTYVQNNQIKYTNADFTDSAFVSAQINALIDGAPGTLDTLNEIAAALNDDDSAVNSLTALINGKDSDFVKSAADQTYIQSQQIKYTTADFTDSAYVTSVLPTLGGDFVDSAYVTSVLPTLGGDFVDSAYVTGLPVSTFNNDANYLDSTTVAGVIDQTYIQNNQIKYTTADFTDSAYVTSVLPTLGGDFVDSAFVTSLPVSTFSNDADYLDSTTVLGVIDQTYVQNNQIKYTTADFTDSAYVTSVLPTLGGDFVDSAQVSTIIIADVIKSFVDALNINAVELGGNDSDYYRLNVYDSAGVLLN